MRSTGCSVPKTLELGTTEYQPRYPGKALKNRFLNCILKHVFRCNPVRGFKERICSPAARGLGSKSPRTPVSFYVPLSKRTRYWATLGLAWRADRALIATKIIQLRAIIQLIARRSEIKGYTRRKKSYKSIQTHSGDLIPCSFSGFLGRAMSLYVPLSKGTLLCPAIRSAALPARRQFYKRAMWQNGKV